MAFSPWPTRRSNVVLSAAFVGFCALATNLSVSAAEDLLTQAKRLRVQQVEQFEALATWCEEQGLDEQATKTRRLLGPRDPFKLYLPILPQEIDRSRLSENATPPMIEWDRRLSRLQREQAKDYFEVARQAVRRNRPSLAFDLLMLTIRTDPDHEKARRILGYQQYRGKWHTRYEVAQIRSGKVWHEKFGWLPRAFIKRYESGDRRVGRNWVTAAEDAALHRDFANGWVVETEHYEIRTNHSLEAGVALGERLERLYRIWGQLFVRYYASESDVKALFEGRGRSTKTPRFRVGFFRSRDDYNRSLRPAMPNIDISVGLYLQQTRCAYFFAGKEFQERTLYHEATHQLFHQSRPVVSNVGAATNFWIVEGAALFMESLREEDGFYVLGGFDDARMHAARYRLLNDDFYVPLHEFTRYGMQRLQSDKRIATLYSQAAGLANFLAFYDGGRYRDALVAYISLVYSGRADAATLSDLTDTPYLELDRQYREFMEESAP